jgi:hypothetical protein
MKKTNNPDWWNHDYDSAWDRVKEALKKDWERTKRQFGGDQSDASQKYGSTLSPAEGNETTAHHDQPTYEEVEPAHRFGFGARSKYGPKYNSWDEDLEFQLKQEWEIVEPKRRQTWMQDRAAIRYGWEFEP